MIWGLGLLVALLALMALAHWASGRHDEQLDREDHDRHLRRYGIH